MTIFTQLNKILLALSKGNIPIKYSYIIKNGAKALELLENLKTNIERIHEEIVFVFKNIG